MSVTANRFFTKRAARLRSSHDASSPTACALRRRATLHPAPHRTSKYLRWSVFFPCTGGRVPRAGSGCRARHARLRCAFPLAASVFPSAVAVCQLRRTWCSASRLPSHGLFASPASLWQTDVPAARSTLRIFCLEAYGTAPIVSSCLAHSASWISFDHHTPHGFPVRVGNGPWHRPLSISIKKRPLADLPTERYNKDRFQRLVGLVLLVLSAFRRREAYNSSTLRQRVRPSASDASHYICFARR